MAAGSAGNYRHFVEVRIITNKVQSTTIVWPTSWGGSLERFLLCNSYIARWVAMGALFPGGMKW
jgi:hypothetical protein